MNEKQLFKAYGSSPEEYQKQLEKDYRSLSDKEYEEVKKAVVIDCLPESTAWIFNEI
tara:strand:- start:144 stop:314 length:171 start_codon:yes stop_codon:yes gene_type:complete